MAENKFPRVSIVQNFLLKLDYLSQVGERDQNTLGLINQQYQGTRQPQVSRGVFSLPGADQHRSETYQKRQRPSPWFYSYKPSPWFYSYKPSPWFYSYKTSP